MSNKVFIIPTIDPPDAICDFVYQTAKELSCEHSVYVIQIQESYTLKKIFSKNPKKMTSFGIKKARLVTPVFIIPLQRFKRIRELNINIFWLTFQLYLFLFERKKSFYLWSFFPELSSFSKSFVIGKKIYDIIDFHDSPNEAQRRVIHSGRNYLLNHSDIVTCTSHALKLLLQPKTNKNIVTVPQGFSVDTFEAISKRKDSKTTKPIIGFIGGINNRLDYNLLIKLVSNHPEWNFKFVGPIGVDPMVRSKPETLLNKLLTLPNVIYFGQKHKSLIPNLMNSFDVCMIPYDVSENFNKYCYPMKLFEYFYMGKPVISTPIEELRRFPQLVKIGENANEWEKHIQSLLDKKWPEKYKQEQQKLAIENSWKEKISLIIKITRLNEEAKNSNYLS